MSYVLWIKFLTSLRFDTGDGPEGNHNSDDLELWMNDAPVGTSVAGDDDATRTSSQPYVHIVSVVILF
jgi:hypothetical protein